MSAPIEAVRGMRDVLPDEQQRLQQVRTRLEALVAHAGYTQVDTPQVEHRELYLRKLGEDLVGKVYEFRLGGRDLALRPEWTASVLRSYVAHMQEQPLPLRLSYCGPVFRYERPQRTTYRQFTQLGVELLGGAVPRADAEVLALACAGLEQVGIASYQVRIGHIGLVRALLARLGLAERTQGALLWSLERLRTQGRDAVHARLHQTYGDSELPFDPSLLAGLDDVQAEALVLHALQMMRVNLSAGTRTPEAIVSRLVRKLRRDDPQPRIDQALELLDSLSQICGAPAEVLPRATDLLAALAMPTTALDELRALLVLLEAHGVPAERLTLDFGLGRGLHYYTGMIFELYADNGAQLCGGGRYDDLVTALGGRQAVPAVGFAYGLERLLQTAAPPAMSALARVLVAAVTDDDYAYALRVASQLRAQGFAAILDVRGRGVASNLRDAARRGLNYVALVGADERARDEVLWRDLAAHSEQRLSRAQLATLAPHPGQPVVQ